MPDGQYVKFTQPEGGGGSGGPPACNGTPATSPLATWANVKEVVNGSDVTGGGCYGLDCHTTNDRKPYLLAVGSSPLPDDELYTLLTTFKTETCAQRVLVKPCEPDQSAFYRSQAATCEDLDQMPFGCLPENDNCTPNDKLEGIRQWIAAGAKRP